MVEDMESIREHDERRQNENKEEQEQQPQQQESEMIRTDCAYGWICTFRSSCFCVRVNL